MYNKFINQLKEEIKEKTLHIIEDIQILRDNRGQVVEWYYSDKEMIELYELAESDPCTEEEGKRIMKKYEEDKPYLQSVSVANLLIELEEGNKIL